MTMMALHSVAHFVVFIAFAAAYPTVPVSQEFPTEAAALQASWQTQNVAQKRITGAVPEGASHPDITQVLTRSPVLGPDYNVRQEPPPSEEELQAPRRRRQAVEDAQAEADDDSDMYLEPDDEPKQEAKPSEMVARYEYGMDSPSPDSQGYPQHFFPSFAPVFSLGHSRPPQLYHQKYPNIENVFLQEPEAYKPRVQQPEFNPFKTYRDSFQSSTDTEEEASAHNNNLLGSGNFGVIRGGTYYNDEDRNNLNPYYNNNNGHGRPYFSNPRPQKYTGGDFFANFRDFAEINTPTKASFSEYVIVYVNKNGTELAQTPTDPARPKNIIEQLSLLDKESEDSSEKKLSSHKRKLAVLRRGEEAKLTKKLLRKKETIKDLQEPLLALS